MFLSSLRPGPPPPDQCCPHLMSWLPTMVPKGPKPGLQMRRVPRHCPQPQRLCPRRTGIQSLCGGWQGPPCPVPRATPDCWSSTRSHTCCSSAAQGAWGLLALQAQTTAVSVQVASSGGQHLLGPSASGGRVHFLPLRTACPGPQSAADPDTQEGPVLPSASATWSPSPAVGRGAASRADTWPLGYRLPWGPRTQHYPRPRRGQSPTLGITHGPSSHKASSVHFNTRLRMTWCCTLGVLALAPAFRDLQVWCEGHRPTAGTTRCCPLGVVPAVHASECTRGQDSRALAEPFRVGGKGRRE